MAGPTHRSVSSIKSSTSGGQPAVPAGPHTPHRIASLDAPVSSPSTLRADEDHVIVEFESRYLRAGFACDAYPKAVIGFGPEEQRRAGDYKMWQRGYDTEWRKKVIGREWGEGYELWKLDLRSTDLGLFADQVERALRKALEKYLLLDFRPRNMSLVLPSVLPLPLLTTLLDTIFTNFQPPNISLLASPVLTTIAAGLRTALVIDIGWAETLATAIYEYREVRCDRTIRARKRLTEEMAKLLGKSIPFNSQDQIGGSKGNGSKESLNVVSFEECEDVVSRLAWCKPSKHKVTKPRRPETLPSVEEEDEVELSMHQLEAGDTSADPRQVAIPLKTVEPPTTLKLPFAKLADPCENALFADGIAAVEFDDEELPLHLLVYHTLLRLPVDVRSMCMSRIVFSGSASTIPGLKSRVRDEVEALIRERDWDPVHGSVIHRLQQDQSLSFDHRKQVNSGSKEVSFLAENPSVSLDTPAFNQQEPDPIYDRIQQEARKSKLPSVQGTLRIVESMGSWTGASILAHLKIPSVSIIEREQWLQLGAAGASRQDELSHEDQRPNMGPGGSRAYTIDRLNWTLGNWG